MLSAQEKQADDFYQPVREDERVSMIYTDTSLRRYFDYGYGEVPTGDSSSVSFVPWRFLVIPLYITQKDAIQEVKFRIESVMVW